jgi:hypothetical protein
MSDIRAIQALQAAPWHSEDNEGVVGMGGGKKQP